MSGEIKRLNLAVKCCELIIEDRKATGDVRGVHYLSKWTYCDFLTRLSVAWRK